MLRIIILVIALGAGGLAAWIALTVQPKAVATAPAAVQPPPPPMVDVVVAATDLSQGQAIGEASLRWQAWPESAVGPGHVSRKKQPDALNTLKGSVVRSAILSGEPVREEKLVRGVGLLASMLPSGKRAVAIRVNAEATAGGFVLPNDRVDVIQTVSRPGADGGSESLSRVLLTNIRVLAIDQKVEDPKGGAVAIGKTATLELDPAQVEIISASQATGALSLALRSIADSDDAPIAHQQPASIASVRILRAGRSEVVRVR